MGPPDVDDELPLDEDDMAEPLEQVAVALDRAEPLPPGWVSVWSAGGEEPLNAAWKASVSPYWMLYFLQFLGAPLWHDAERAWQESQRSLDCRCAGGMAACIRCANAIREVVSEIPPLAELV